MVEYVSCESQEKYGYFISENQKKIWNIELELLVEFMRVCRKNNLKFFVAHGTLLGAVRHRGFIPWDDDIDVNMPREDFEKLKKIASEEFKEPFFFQCFETDPYYVYGIAKLRNSCSTGMNIQDIGNKCNNGLFIDIFPMDSIIEDEILRKEQSKMIEYYRGLLYTKIYGKSFHWLLWYGEETWKDYKKDAEKFSTEELYEKFNYWCTKYNNIPNLQREGIVSFLTDYECCYWYKEDYENLSTLKFENIDVPVPQNYDRCLKIKWNNYMEFPPIEKRGYKHCDVVMNAEIPYTKYPIEKFQIIPDMSKNIIIFCGGNICRDFLKYNKNSFSIKFIVDNNKNLHNTYIDGVKIESPDILKEIDNEIFEIVIASLYFEEIEEQLINMEIKNYKIYLPGKILKGEK